MPIDPVDIPIVAPLESDAVPTQVPVTADVCADVVGLLGPDVLPLQPTTPVAIANTSAIVHARIGGSLSS
jgi:hypothetical protein